MPTALATGSFSFPPVTGETPRSSLEALEGAVRDLAGRRDAWSALPINRKVGLLDRMIQDVAATAGRWVSASLAAKGVAPDAAAAWEEWAAGPYVVMLQLRQLRDSLHAMAQTGGPGIPGPLTRRPDGQVVARVFPARPYDRLFWNRVTAEVWMQPGTTVDDVRSGQAAAYRGAGRPGKVALVLGAGNVSGVGASDLLYRLFVRNQVVIYKVNPVNDYLGPLFEESFQALVSQGFLRVVRGGAEEGSFLCTNPAVDEVHVTGSDKTFEAIVFGMGPAGAERKRRNQPLLRKPVTAELGNISPVIVVPGPWTESDLAYQAEHLASMLVANAGFNCITPRVIVQHAGWDGRQKLLDLLRGVLGRIPVRRAYYPGARQRFDTFRSAHPEAECIGSASDGDLPWTLIPGLDPASATDICFTTEAFCSLISETGVPADGAADFIDRAVAFANDVLWGTLAATILVHPRSMEDPAVRTAMDRATADLRYGSVTINQGPGTAFALGVTPWGGYGSEPDLRDIQSGTGFVHNTLMFDRVQKSVVRGVFRARRDPPSFPTHSGGAAQLFAKLVDFEASPSLRKIPAILRAAR